MTASLASLSLLALTVAAAAADPDPDRVALPAKRPGIDQPLALRSVTSLDQKTVALNRGPLVIAMTSTTCPLSRKLAPVLARLSKRVRVVFLDVQGVDSPEDFRAFARRHGFVGELVHDPKRAIAAVLGARTTTEVFLIDRQGKLAYRGAVSDQYGLGVSYDHPRHAYLDDALAALAAGKRPTVASTSSPGCALEIPAKPAAASPITWHGRVQHLMQNCCMRCHHEGGVAPFALETYEQVKDHAGMVSMTVRKKIMPPWFASRNSGPFLNDASLSDKERRDLAAWVRAGTPRGDPARAPKKKTWPGHWSIGKPDQVFELPRPVGVKAEGRMDYVNVQLETNLKEDRWVKAWEVRPTARDVVHHVLVFALRPGQKRVPGGERGDFFAAFVPGNGSAIYPEGVAKKLPKGMTLHFQLHYTPNGRATKDQTRLGVIFAKNPRHEIVTGGIANMRIKIPAGASDHEEFAGVPVPFDAVVLSLMPHMHYRGKAFRYVLLSPKNERTPLLEVPRYDFNWQLAYRFAQPRKIKQGSRIVVFARFDNSKDNPANPDPTRTVRWGDQSDDEMLIGYLEYYVPSIPAGDKVPKLRGTRAQRLWAMLDRDLDGKVSLKECPPRLRAAFHGLDKNGDGFCTLEELEPVNRR